MVDEWEIIAAMAEKLYSNLDWSPNDAAYFKLGDETYFALSVDTIVDKTDVPREMTLLQAGRKAAVSVVSDLASKGVKPLGMLFSISMPRTYGLREAREIAEGLKRAADEYSFKLIGGDTNESDNLVLTCCGFGLTKRLIERRGARPGDVVATTGLFGLQPLGLTILRRGWKPKNDLEEEAVKSVLQPRARLTEGLTAASTGLVTSSIDSSDGLSISLHQIAEASKVKVLIDRVPLYPGLEEKCGEIGLTVRDLVFFGGEEFELIFTVKGDSWNEFKREFSKRKLEIHRIGEIAEGRGVFTIKGGEEVKLEKKGWIHFKSN